MKNRKSLSRLLISWILASGLIAAWGWLNIAFIGTPFWLDAAFGFVLILIPSRWLRQLGDEASTHRAWRIASTLVLALAALAGILWASISFLFEFRLTPNDSGFPS